MTSGRKRHVEREGKRGGGRERERTRLDRNKSRRRTSLRSQPRHFSAMGLMNGEPIIVWLFTIWSSSIIMMSSTALTTYVPVSLYGRMSKSTPFHSFIMLSSALSSACSFSAMVHTSSTAGQCCRMPSSMSCCSVRSSSGEMSLPARTRRRHVSDFQSTHPVRECVLYVSEK